MWPDAMYSFETYMECSLSLEEGFNCVPTVVSSLGMNQFCDVD